MKNTTVSQRFIIFLLLSWVLSSISSTPAQAAECTKSSTFVNGYIYVAFKDTSATCTWTIPSDASIVDFLVVAGGGSGGSRHAGGGGAGGVETRTGVSLAGVTSLSISIGAGGSSVIPSTYNYAVGNIGSNSVISKNAGSGTFSTVTSIGGGGGEAGGVKAANSGGGGSGGGNQYPDSSSGTPGEGNAGGSGATDSSWWSSGGGGGAGAPGGNASSSGGGIGGAGIVWITDFTTTIATSLGFAQTNQTSGNQVYFAGGGGGSSTTGTAGTGGLGGGGAAIIGSNTATSGTANSGGGGGGSGCCNGGNSGAGGSGVAIFRYPANAGLNLAVSNSISYRQSTPVVATANIDGNVSFFANGRIIPACRNLSTISKTVTCNWKPSLHGSITLTASISSSTYSGYTGSTKTQARAISRTNNR